MNYYYLQKIDVHNTVHKYLPKYSGKDINN